MSVYIQFHSVHSRPRLFAALQGRTMPAVPMHAASFQGSVARFEVQTQSSKQQPNRFRITCHSNMYIGQIRRLIASKLQAQAEHVRLFAHGGSSVTFATPSWQRSRARRI